MSTEDPRCDGFWQSARTPQFLLTIVLIVVGMAVAWATMDQHTRDPNIHQTTACLDKAYVRRDVQDEQLAAIRERLERIERKLDELSSRGN